MALNRESADSCDAANDNDARLPIGSGDSVVSESTTLHIQNVEEALAAIRLHNPTFPFLTLDPNYIRVLMFQPEAVIEAAADRVCAQDRVRLSAQMKAFLAKAQQFSADLVLCPEYSCTWEALIESIEAGISPSDGKLWALGCESATPDRLNVVLQRLSSQLNVIFDDTVLTSAGNFVDALVYLFRTHTEDGRTALLTAIIQTKTQPMGGTSFELQYLKTGRTLYRFRNSAVQSNSLIGLLCSDTLHPGFESFIPQLRTDTLVLHLQLNANPSLPGFRQYRSDCCTHAPRTSEVLCLNWARGTAVLAGDGTIKPFIAEPKSILFRDKQQVLDDDAHIMANHSKGCYLTNWQELRTAAFVFSPDPHLFYFETTKPATAGHAVTAIRTGPRMIDLWSWVNGTADWQSSAAADRFEEYWVDSYPELQGLLRPLLPRYLEAERLIQLCTGRALGMNWANCWKLRSFELADDDTTRRLTVCWSDTGAGLSFRQQCLSDFRGFAGVVTSPSAFTSRLQAFRDGGFVIEYRAAHLFETFRNMHRTDTPSATAIYLGQSPPNEKLREIKKRTMEGLYETNSDSQLLAIWYRDHNGVLHDFMDEDVPQINADPGEAPVAIDNTQP